jgi:hypothetical protein
MHMQNFHHKLHTDLGMLSLQSYPLYQVGMEVIERIRFLMEKDILAQFKVRLRNLRKLSQIWYTDDYRGIFCSLSARTTQSNHCKFQEGITTDKQNL